MIPGASPVIAGQVPKVELAYCGIFNSNTDALSYSFGSVDIGAASAKRFVVVGVDANMDVVTVNGVGLSVFHSFDFCFLWGGLVTSGSGAVTVATSRASVTLGHMSLGVWTIKNLRSTTPIGTAGTSAVGTPSGSLSVQAGGAAVGIGRSNGGFASIAFGGLSLDGTINNDASFPIGVGSLLTPSTTSLSVSFSSSGSFKEFAAASFR